MGTNERSGNLGFEQDFRLSPYRALSACLSNMRELGQSLTLFTHEHRGYLPKAWFNDAVEGPAAEHGGID